MSNLRSSLIRLAHQKPELRATLLPLLKTAMEFETEDALKKYLDEHPDADKSKHSVKKKDKDEPKKDESKKDESEDLTDVHEDATVEDLPEKIREEISEYKMDIVGKDAKTAVDLARKVKEGISKSADICKMNPPVCVGNKGLTRDKMPQIEGETSTRVMLMSDEDRVKHGDGKEDDGKFETTNEEGDSKRVAFSELSEKEQGKKKKDWGVDRKKGKAMVEAGADPNSDKSIMAQMVDSLEKKGIKTTKKKMAVGLMKATQKEIQANKTFGMADAYMKGKFKNIGNSVIVSKDGHILDGHHRWAALLTIDASREMDVQEIDMTMDELLDEAANFPGVYKANIEGDPLPEADQKKYKEENKAKAESKSKGKKDDKPKDEDKKDKSASLYGRVVRLAHAKPSLRPYLLPLIKGDAR